MNERCPFSEMERGQLTSTIANDRVWFKLVAREYLSWQNKQMFYHQHLAALG